MLTYARRVLHMTPRDPSKDLAAELRLLAHAESRAPTPDCLGEDAVAAFVDGALAGDERARVVSHLANCAWCRSAVRSTAALMSDVTVQREMPDARGRRRWSRSALAIAAAAAIIVLVTPFRQAGEDGQLRESAVTTTIAPVALTPRESARVGEPLVWSSVPGAQRYHVRVQRADGSLLWSSQTQDTVVQLPDSVRLSPGATYYWRVEAQTEWQRRVASDLTRFIVPGTPE